MTRREAHARLRRLGDGPHGRRAHRVVSAPRHDPDCPAYCDDGLLVPQAGSACRRLAGCGGRVYSLQMR